MKINTTLSESLRRASFTVCLASCLLAALRSFAATDEIDYAGKISKAKLFLTPITWISNVPPSIEESRELYEAAGLDPSQKPSDVLGSLEGFVKTHPDSQWTPSLLANLARYYRTLGRYSVALDYWQRAWKATKDSSDPHSRFVADYALAYWTQLLSSLGRVEEMKQLLASVNGRQMSSPEFQQQFDLARFAVGIMQHEPGTSYRCGTLALYNVAQALNVKTNIGPLADMASPSTGFSISQLVDLSDQYQLGLVAVKRPSGNQLVVPSVVHWKETHYAAIVAKRDGAYKVIDPTFGRPQWLSPQAINENASGYFLVSTNAVPKDWQVIARNDTKTIFGKGFSNSKNPKPSGPPCSSASGNPLEPQTCPPKTCAPGSFGSPPASGQGGNGTGVGGGGGGGGGRCGGGCISSSGPNGMTDWEVQEPYISLWLHDRPMVYNMSVGRQFVLQIDYHQRETRPLDISDIDIHNFGPNWNCNWLTYIQVDGNVIYSKVGYDCIDPETGHTNCCEEDVTSGGFHATEYCPDGGERDYFWGNTNDETIDLRTHVQFNPSEYQTTNADEVCSHLYDERIDHFASNTLVYPNGSVAVFNLVIPVSTFPEEKIAFLTSATDPQGHVMRYYYDTNDSQILLTGVVDFDGKTNQLIYGNTNYPTSVTQITNTAYHLAVNFNYDTNGFLTNIVDVIGISSSFRYTFTNDLFYTNYDIYGHPVALATNSTWLLTTLETPYGDTSFDYFHPTWPLFGDTPDNDINRAITVTQPDNGKHLFLYKDSAGGVGVYYPGASCSSGDFAANLAFFHDTSDPDDELDHSDSFYWGPRQYSTIDPPVFTNAMDYTFARKRNWLRNPATDDSLWSVSQSLNLEDETPDDADSSVPQSIWYGYTGKTSDYVASTNEGLPCSVGYYISRDWSGNTFLVENTTRNSLGNPLSVVTIGGDDSCASQLIKTNRYVYAGNDIDVLQHIGPDGVVQELYSYDGYHDVISTTNALGEVTRYTYNGGAQITSISRPSGLITTNIYGSDGFLATTYDYAVIGGSTVYYGTNSYTYTNGLVLSHTDERGLTVTNSWDALQRLTQVSYPDGTSISYTYSNLDLIRVVDRMGFTNSYGYDSMQRKIAETNALGNYTLYSYCTCGSLDSIQDALGNVTSFYYSMAGHLTNTVYADSYSIKRGYNMAGQLVTVTDSSGNNVTNWYDRLMRLTSVSNTVGQIAQRIYDIKGRVTNSVDANGVSVNLTYDDFDRLRTRRYPDGGTDAFGYTLNVFGATSYTNQLNNVWTYAYDPRNLKTNDIGTGIYTNAFAYNSAGDCLILTDGKSQKTSWNYDEFGRVTNKVDNLGTNLFVYKFDPDNRLTNRLSAAKGSTVYKYDATGNLTNVVYAVDPQIKLRYDALNRVTNMVDAVGTTKYSYDAVGEILCEDGPWDSDTVSYTYQNHLRTRLSISAPNASAWTQSYGYDPARRLISVASLAGEFDYILGGASSASRMIKKLSLPSGAYITNTYDNVARLTGTYLKNSGNTVLDSESYSYNPGNQRTQEVFTAGNFIDYTHDNIGQLKTAQGLEAGGTTNRIQEQFGYVYDPAGNLILRTNNSLLQTVGVNSLNELTNITRSGTLTVAGTTTSVATNVTVNSLTAVLYGDYMFAKDGLLLVDGTTNFTAIAKDPYGRQDTDTILVSLAATNNFAYDLNGNMLTNGTEVMVWNDENELVTNFVAGAWKSEFMYDGALRQRVKRDYSWDGSAWTQTNEVHFIYDGNTVIQHRNGNNLPLLTLTRGTDLSDSLQGAGGIGGLLAMTESYAVNPTHSYHHADGNGNVTCLTDTNQSIVAKAEYDPFGNFLSISGPKAYVNVYWFSSKLIHWQSGKYDFLYRWYAPQLNRWLNRDPIQELGGINLFSFVQNQPTTRSDFFGLIMSRCAAATAAAAAAYTAYLDDPNNNTLSAWIAANSYAFYICGLDRPPSPPTVPPIVCPLPESPDPGPRWDPNRNCQKVAVAAGGVTAGYIIYRCVRLIPSLFPPLWETLPINVAAP